MDVRQMVAALLTISMFVMLGNMIKRDHFDSLEENVVATSNIQRHTAKVSRLNTSPGVTKEPWKGDNIGEALKPCWNKPALPIAGDRKQSKGFIIFSLTDGPEYHISQISNAVKVARYLGATLVLPDIRGTKPGDQKRNFGEIYDVKKFVESIDGVIRIAKDLPIDELQGSYGNLITTTATAMRVPNMVSESYIATHIAPLFHRELGPLLRLQTSFPTLINPSKKFTEQVEEVHDQHIDSISCLVMFGTLALNSELQGVVELMIQTLRGLSQRSSNNGLFVAVDLRVEKLEMKGKCHEYIGRNCYFDNAHEIAEFLMKIGFKRDTTIYLTQSGWNGVLDPLRQVYPKTYTKEDIIPIDKKKKFLNKQSTEFAKVVDFHICSKSDVFVAAVSNHLFYTNVVGRRIASGKTQIIVPSKAIASSSSFDVNYISPYVLKRTHLAYSCFC